MTHIIKNDTDITGSLNVSGSAFVSSYKTNVLQNVLTGTSKRIVFTTNDILQGSGFTWVPTTGIFTNTSGRSKIYSIVYTSTYNWFATNTTNFQIGIYKNYVTDTTPSVAIPGSWTTRITAGLNVFGRLNISHVMQLDDTETISIVCNNGSSTTVQFSTVTPDRFDVFPQIHIKELI